MLGRILDAHDARLAVLPGDQRAVLDRLWVDVRVPAGREPVLDGLARQACAATRKGET